MILAILSKSDFGTQLDFKMSIFSVKEHLTKRSYDIFKTTKLQGSFCIEIDVESDKIIIMLPTTVD